MTILHVADPCKFTRPFFDFLAENMPLNDHEIISRAPEEEWSSDLAVSSVNARGVKWLYAFFRSANNAEKIILHNLFDVQVLLFLFLQPWLLKKCYWVIWGADLYTYSVGARTLKWKIKEILRKPVIKKVAYMVTYIEGDVSLAREWYAAGGKYRECIAYTSNLYKNIDLDNNEEEFVHIQVGNSADSSNNHIEVLEYLQSYANENIKVSVPLSYGDKDNARKVCEKGRELLGDKFFPMLDFMSLESYMDFLGSVDIAIFNHSRQQAMGNTISLLSLGKKVYMKTNGAHYRMLSGIGVKLFDAADIELSRLSSKDQENNRIAIRNYFSEKKLLSQWKSIFEE